MKSPTRSVDCVSDLTLDRLLAGELEGQPLSSATEAHLSQCAACHARHQALREALTRFPQEHFVSGLAAQARARSRRFSAPKVTAAVGSLLALAASLLVVVHVSQGPTERVKGSEALSVVVKRLNGKVEPMLSGTKVSPGEAIRFRVVSPKAAWVFVVGMDSAGQVSPYAEGDGTGLPWTAGTDAFLDGSIVLDQTLGPEQLVALFCAKPLPASTVLAAARGALTQSNGHPEKIHALSLDCVQRFFLLNKAAR